MSKGFNFTIKTIPDPQPSSISARTDKYSKLSPRLFNPFELVRTNTDEIQNQIKLNHQNEIEVFLHSD